jgi:hypothetical protein
MPCTLIGFGPRPLVVAILKLRKHTQMSHSFLLIDDEVDMVSGGSHQTNSSSSTQTASASNSGNISIGNVSGGNVTAVGASASNTNNVQQVNFKGFPFYY